MTFFEVPHRRYNALSGEWVFVSPHRNRRPWQGRREDGGGDAPLFFDPHCYLCPGNQRAGGIMNDPYIDTYVFTNDFAALLPDTVSQSHQPHPLMRAESVAGTCKVICFSHDHGMTLARMSPADVLKVIDTWAREVEEMGKTYRWVQIFENKGEIMGCSNPHPHCQIWAGDFLPNEPAKEETQQRDYFIKSLSQTRPTASAPQNPVLLMDYLELELKEKTRVVYQNEHWVVLVPFWAVWPFETMLLPRRHVLRFPDLDGAQREALADIMKNILVRYDNMFHTSFPYTMGWHGAPFGAGDYAHWQLHAHFYPPLLRSATVRKFMVGYEMMAEAQRDITAEIAAQTLRDLPTVHYKESLNKNHNKGT